MRFLKLIIISFFVLFLAVTMLGLLFPSTVIVSRATDINAPSDSIFSLVKNMYGWERWMEGMADTSVKIEGPTKALLGKTWVEIKSAKPSSIQSIWTGKNGKIQTGKINLFTDSAHAKTVVQWEFQQKLQWYPWERFASMMNDKILGTMMEKNLNHLKNLLEQNPQQQAP